MLSTFGRRITSVVAILIGLQAPLFAAQESKPQSDPEFLCLKQIYGPYEGLAIACYSSEGCDFVEKLGAESLPDYDQASVAAALGREKIEGIVTSSAAIIKEIKSYGYTCKAVD
jgi:hypothetical protein